MVSARVQLVRLEHLRDGQRASQGDARPVRGDFVFLDAGLVLKLRAGSKKFHTFLLLGFTLGLGYLAKAIMFPMACVFMGVAFLAGGGRRKAVLPSTAMLLVFSAMAAPLFIGISEAAGQPTFGESGTVNYALYVVGDRLPPFDFADPLPNLKHPVHRIYEHPSVYEFGQPFLPTYPLSFDHWYWYNGVKIQLNLRGQLQVIGESLTVFYANLVLPMWGLIAGFLILTVHEPESASVPSENRQGLGVACDGGCRSRPVYACACGTALPRSICFARVAWFVFRNPSREVSGLR
jgi:hypothetical protein